MRCTRRTSSGDKIIHRADLFCELRHRVSIWQSSVRKCLRLDLRLLPALSKNQQTLVITIDYRRSGLFLTEKFSDKVASGELIEPAPALNRANDTQGAQHSSLAEGLVHYGLGHNGPAQNLSSSKF